MAHLGLPGQHAPNGRTAQLLLLVLCGAAGGALLTTFLNTRGSSAQQQAQVNAWAELQSRALSRVAAEVAAFKERLATLQLGTIAQAAKPVAAAPPPANGPLVISGELAARNVSFKGAAVTVLAPRNDEYVGGSILATGAPFEPDTLGYMLDHVKQGSTVVDAGCNFGSYSVFFATKVGPGGAVHCFEPQRKMAQLANANAVANGLSRVMAVHNLALSFGPGSVEMAAKLPDGAFKDQAMAEVEARHGSINYGGMKLGKGGERTQAVTLDSFMLEGVSFIKIDVQGAEQLMLYGAQDTIRRNLPVVVYEHLPGWNVTQDMIDSMKVPQKVLDWSIDAFFKSEGYTATVRGQEVLQAPPASEWAQKGRRRLLRGA